MEFWALIYTHRHGTDVTLYKTRDEAVLGKVQLILEWIKDEISSAKIRKQILKLISEGQWDEASCMYEDESNEFFEIAKTEVGSVEDLDSEQKRLKEEALAGLR